MPDNKKGPKPENNNKQTQGGRGNQKPRGGGERKMRGPVQKKADAMKRAGREAQNANRRGSEMADKLIEHYLGQSDEPNRKRATVLDRNSKAVRLIGLGGMDDVGSKNMILIETANDAVVIDCGNDLSVDLPGINFGIADITYLEKIKQKLRGYVITHGHLDHIGGLPFILPKLPAPVYGSRFTIGMVESILANTDADIDPQFRLESVVMNQDNHERLKLGADFTVELVRVTHAIPGSTLVVLDTPAGKIVNSGDFRLDPEPLDDMPSDIDRMKEIGKEGVLALLSESTATERIGRTPTESTLEESFHDIIRNAPGRVFVGTFSSNMNRIQMVVNAAVADGYKVAFDGRSMMTNLEIAVRLGFMKIPKGTVMAMSQIGAIPKDKVVVMCTGSQAEPNAALQRMSIGEHKHVKMKPQDTVIFSSTPIPGTGNDARVERLVDDLMRKGVHVYQHLNRDISGSGPLHVSGHASRDEYVELIEYFQPKFFLPIYGNYSRKQAYIEMAVENNLVPRDRCYNGELGEVIEFTPDSMKSIGEVDHGTVMVDNTGAVVPELVVKDRLMMAEGGLVTVILTVSGKNGQVMTSPDIISRGFVYLKENEELLNEIRREAKFFSMRKFTKLKVDDFKNELRGHLQAIIYRRTEKSPMIITVVNTIGGGPSGGKRSSGNGGKKNGEGKGSDNRKGGKRDSGQPSSDKQLEEQARLSQQRLQQRPEDILFD